RSLRPTTMPPPPQGPGRSSISRPVTVIRSPPMAEPSTLEACTEPLRVAFDVALLDLDGVVYRGDLAVPHAADALAEAREAGLQMMFVTNNASRTPDTVARHLTDLGAPTGPEEVTTAAQAAARLVAADADEDTRVLPIGGD